jgi:hypothetical protein
MFLQVSDLEAPGAEPIPESLGLADVSILEVSELRIDNQESISDVGPFLKRIGTLER